MSRYLISISGLLCVLVLTTAGCSKDAGAYAASGDAYVADGKLGEAIVEYRNAIQEDPQLGEVRLKLAKAYEQMKDRAGAAREYVRAADLLPSNEEAQVRAGSYLLLAGQFEDAKTRADKALALNPKNTDAQLLKASALGYMKDLDGAIREMEEALKIDPEQPRIYGGLAVLELAKGNTAEAEGAFRRAVEIDPKAVSSHIALASFLLTTNRLAEAEKLFLTALQLEPKNLRANRALAVFYMTTNRAAQAEPYLKTMAEVTPDGSGALGLADYYIRMQRSAEARKVLEGVSGNQAIYSETQRRLAALLYADKKPVEAHKALAEVLSRNAKDAQALLLRAHFQRAEGKRDEAMASARASVAANPSLAAGHYLIGELLSSRGQVDEAIASFTEVLRLNPRVAGAQIELARLNLTKVGGAESSVLYAQQALANQPGNPYAQLILVHGFLARGEIGRAEREMQSLVNRLPKVALVQAEMGKVLVTKNDLAGARQYDERALQIDPNLVDAVAGLTAVDVAARRFDAARNRVDAKLAERPSHPGLLELAARTAMASGETARAEAHLRRLIEVAPEQLSAYELLAGLYIRQQKLDEARTELTRLASKQEKPVGAHTMIGLLYAQQGRTDEARKMYEQVLAYDPRAAVAANNLAWMMAERGEDLDLALKYAQTAKAVLPDLAEVSDTLAWIYYKKDLASLAVEPLKHAVQKDPKNAIYHYHLGLVYLKTGDTAKARQSLQQALAINPAFAQAEDAKAKLGTL